MASPFGRGFNPLQLHKKEKGTYCLVSKFLFLFAFSRTKHEKHVHLMKFTNCPKPFHALSVPPLKKPVPLQRQTKQLAINKVIHLPHLTGWPPPSGVGGLTIMKKFFTIISMTIMLFASANTVNAQTYRESSICKGKQVLVVSDERLIELCRDQIRKGDDEFRRGDFRSAQYHYEKARDYNDDCHDRRYISPRELDHKIDDCVYAQKHHGETLREAERRHEAERREDERLGAALVGALIGSAINSSTQKAPAAKPAPAPAAPAASTQLMHYNQNGISYEANSSDARLTRIERTEESVTLHFEYLDMNKVHTLSINDAAYLKDHSTGRKIAPSSLRGITYTTQGAVRVEAGDCYDFSITFPALPADCHNVDFVEPNQTGWKFYHISI